MPKDLKYYQQLASEMIEADKPRDVMLQAMDAMNDNDWNLPGRLKSLGWIYKFVGPEPSNSINTAVNVLSEVEARIRMSPYSGAEADIDTANKMEKALEWHFRKASRRGYGKILNAVVRHAVLYDEVTMQVVYLPEFWKGLGVLKGAKGISEMRQRASMTYGPFMVLAHNPQQVHAQYSDQMLESVLLKRLVRRKEVNEMWGDHAKELNKGNRFSTKVMGRISGQAEKEFEWVTVYDYIDYEERVVWGVEQEHGGNYSNADAEGGVEIYRADNDMGFIPWACSLGNNADRHHARYPRNPLLARIYKAGLWELMNLLSTLNVSEGIAYSGAPRLKESGPTDIESEVDYGEAGRKAMVPPGKTLEAMEAPGIDEAIFTLGEKVRQAIRESSLPEVLQSANVPSGTPFASLNLSIQSAIKQLSPSKDLAEEGLAKMFETFIKWVHYSKVPLKAMYQTKNMAKYDQIEIHADEIDVEFIDLEVELTADVPLDKTARMNQADIAYSKLNAPLSEVLEMTGVHDPNEWKERRMAEDKEWQKHQIEMSRRQMAMERDEQIMTMRAQFRVQMEQQDEMMAKQQQAQQTAQQQAQQQQQGDGSLAQALRNPQIQAAFRNGGVPVGEGQGFDPGAGGQSAIEANPDQTNVNPDAIEEAPVA